MTRIVRDYQNSNILSMSSSLSVTTTLMLRSNYSCQFRIRGNCSFIQ